MRSLFTAPLPGGIAGPPSAVSAAPNRLDVFAAGPQNQPWHWRWDGSMWHGPATLPAAPNGIPAEGLCAVTSGQDRIELFAAASGINSPLWWRGVGNSWTLAPKQPAAGANLPPEPVAAVCNGPDDIEVFAASPLTKGPFWWKWNGSSWVGPVPLAAGNANLPAERIAAISHTPGKVHVFAAGGGNHLWHWKPIVAGAWSVHDRGGNLPAGAVSAVSWGPGRYDVFAASPAGLQHWWEDGGTFQGPENLPGLPLPGTVTATSHAVNRLDVFGISGNGRLMHWQWDGSRWTGPHYRGENLAGWDVSAVVRAPRRIDVFAAGTGGTLRQWPGGGLENAVPYPWHNWPTNRSANVSCLRPDSLDELVSIVKEAGQQGKTVRAIGSSWSNSDVAVPKDYVVDTDKLAGIVTGVLDTCLTPSAAPLSLVHVEAGIKVHNLNLLLDERGLALKTMGGSSGQSLAGVLSTGVHGMDHQDLERSTIGQMVRAIHLVGPDGAQHWIEPADGITTPAGVQAALGLPAANVHYDDDWFSSVLVSVGSLGIIYSVVMEVESAHDIREVSEPIPWTEVKDRLRLHGNPGDPFLGNRGVQVTINPYRVGDGSHPAYLNTRTSVRPRTNPSPVDPIGVAAGYLAPALLWGFKNDPDSIDDVLTEITKKARPPLNQGWSHTVMGGPGLPLARGLTVEIAFDATNDKYLDFIDAVLEMLHTAYYDGNQPERLGYLGWIALRFQGQSRGYLSPQSRTMKTATVEFAMFWRIAEQPGAEWGDTPKLLRMIEDKGREHHGIQHWGMFDNLTRADVERAYPKLDAWRRVRWELTKNGTVTTFDSDFTRRCGLSAPPRGPLRTSQPSLCCVVSRSPDYIDLFVADTAGETFTAAMHPAMASGWGGWSSLLGGIAAPGAPVTAVSRRLDYLDAFVVGQDGGAYTCAWTPTDGWRGFWRIGSEVFPKGAMISAVVRGEDHLDIFATDSNGRILTAAWEPGFADGWHGWWHLLNGYAAPGAPVSAVSRSQHKLDVFVTGADGAAYTAAWEPAFNDGWHGWWRIGSATFPQATPIGSVTRSADHLDVFATDTNGRILTAAWEPAFNDGWHGWWQIQNGHAVAGAPVTAVSRSADKLDVFVVGTDNTTYSAAWEPSFADGWHGWWNLSGGKAAHGSRITAVSRRPDFLDVFVIGREGAVCAAAWSPGQPWSAWWAMNN